MLGRANRNRSRRLWRAVGPRRVPGAPGIGDLLRFPWFQEGSFQQWAALRNRWQVIMGVLSDP